MDAIPARRPPHRRPADLANARAVQCLIDEVCNVGDLDRLDAFLAPEAAQPGSGRNADIKQALRLFHAAVPDARWTIQEQVAAGGTVVTRLQVQGTHRSGLWGIAPTGKVATVTGVLIVRFAHGRIVTCWAQGDLLGLLCQLGVLPTMDLEHVVAVARVLRAGEVWAGGQQPGGSSQQEQSEDARAGSAPTH